MKLLKFNSVKLALCITIIFALIEVSLMNMLSMLVVDSVDLLLFNGILIIFVYLIDKAFLALNEKAKATASYYLKLQMSQWIDRYIANLSSEKFFKKNSSEYATLYVNDVPRIISLILDKQIKIVFNVALIITILIALLNIHWMMLLMGILMIIIMIFPPMLFNKNLSEYIIQSQKSKETFLNTMSESILGFSAYLENQSFSIFNKKSRVSCYSYAKEMCDVDTYAGCISAILEFISTLASTLSLIVLSYLVITNQAPVGTLLATITLMPTLGNAIADVMSDRTFYKSGINLFTLKFKNIETSYNKEFCKPYLFQKLDKIKEYPESIKQNEIIRSIQTKNIEIVFKDKHIKIKDCFFEYPKKYAIVGESGCGKSTLLKIICGEHESYQGDVLINNEVKNKSSDLFTNIAYVNQNCFLFNDSLYQNIALGKDVPIERIDELLKIVGLTEFNARYIIKEGGKNFSGGQKQRIALCRALVTDKSVILLDEATSSLDKYNAENIEEYLLGLPCMVIMITHRLTKNIEQKLDDVINLSQN